MTDKQLALVLTLYQDRLYEALNKIKKENPEMLEIRKNWSGTEEEVIPMLDDIYDLLSELNDYISDLDAK